MPAKRLLAFLLVCTAPAAMPLDAGTTLLTVVGNALDPDSDTILIDPRAVSVLGHRRTMNLRLNRARERTSTDGIRFRSFDAEVEFDCARRDARFTKTRFYEGALWTRPGQYMVYPPAMVRPLAFREFEPNPRTRVIAAACGIKAGS